MRAARGDADDDDEQFMYYTTSKHYTLSLRRNNTFPANRTYWQPALQMTDSDI